MGGALTRTAGLQEVGEGSVRYLQKPFDVETLAREVRAALEEGSTTSPP